ncbi:MAG: tRNA glutamyl-Q(34) synthetase GluQRS [Pseudomonadota bacterium]
MITRFAPSPTGPLHLGHAFSALTAFGLAKRSGGTCLLRIDDIDQARSRPEFEAMIFDDLAWLGLTWPEPVLRQSSSAPHLADALDRLAALGLIYPCSCSRRDIAEAAGAPQEGVPSHGPDGRIYPGTCRGRSLADRTPGDALRLDMARALALAGALPAFTEKGPERPGIHQFAEVDFTETIGDVVVSRKGGAPAYHLSVVIDDAAQKVSLVTRGLDLFDATPIHVLLQHLLGLPVPDYHHHRLIRDAAGKRLAKRDDARSLASYRAEGKSPADIRMMLGIS